MTAEELLYFRHVIPDIGYLRHLLCFKSAGEDVDGNEYFYLEACAIRYDLTTPGSKSIT